MSEEKKQRLKEYQKNYRESKRSQYNNEQNSFLIMIVNSVYCNLVKHIIIIVIIINSFLIII